MVWSAQPLGCHNNYSNYPNIILKYPNVIPSKNPEVSYNDYANYVTHSDEHFYYEKMKNTGIQCFITRVGADIGVVAT